MGQNVFDQALKGLGSEAGEIGDALNVLDAMCESVQENTNDAVLCWRERGYLTNLGQEWRIMMAAAAPDAPKLVMLRAHVMPDGFPVRLDLYEDEIVTCNTEEELETALAEFLGQRHTRDSLNLLASR